MNGITITGRLTRDPEQRSLPSGDTLCVLRLAVDQMAPGRHTGYVDVTSYGKPGEAAARVLTKGLDGRRRRPAGAPHLAGQDRREPACLPGHRQRRVLAAPRAKDITDDRPDDADEEAASDQA